MFKGYIKKWFEARGFGFIAQEAGGADIFVHITHCRDIQPREGLEVRFDIVADDRNEHGRADHVQYAT